jgi:hypothetical protein
MARQPSPQPGIGIWEGQKLDRVRLGVQTPRMLYSQCSSLVRHSFKRDFVYVLRLLAGIIAATRPTAIRGAMGSRERRKGLCAFVPPAAHPIRITPRGMVKAKNAVRRARSSGDGPRRKSTMVITADAEGLLMRTPSMKCPSSGPGPISVR